MKCNHAGKAKKKNAQDATLEGTPDRKGTGRRNAQDATLINIRALKKQVKALEKRVKKLESTLDTKWERIRDAKQEGKCDNR